LKPDDAQMYLELYRNANAEDAFDYFAECAILTRQQI